MDRYGDRQRERADLTEQVLELFSSFCSAMLINLRESWLSLDLTVPQIKVLLIATSARVTTGQIARRLGVALPSATRLVDRLVEHGLVSREEDPRDRRYTMVLPTEAGRTLVESLNAYRRDSLGTVLAALNLDELREVRRSFEHLVAVCPAGEPETGDAPKETVRG